MFRSFVLARHEAEGNRPRGMNVFVCYDGRGMLANQKTGWNVQGLLFGLSWRERAIICVRVLFV